MITFDYGMRDKNPIDAVRFYQKHNPEKPIVLRKEEVCILFLGCLRICIDDIDIKELLKVLLNSFRLIDSILRDFKLSSKIILIPIPYH